jgi:hypothetical protein
MPDVLGAAEWKPTRSILSGKLALVTGGGSGLGLAIAGGLAKPAHAS